MTDKKFRSVAEFNKMKPKTDDTREKEVELKHENNYKNKPFISVGRISYVSEINKTGSYYIIVDGVKVYMDDCKVSRADIIFKVVLSCQDYKEVGEGVLYLDRKASYIDVTIKNDVNGWSE